ncbi:ABC transporter permease [Candidatus Poribacteria bacterium]|nr:ABC transporter permease [Candidatus Poribacteria bacterium]
MKGNLGAVLRKEVTTMLRDRGSLAMTLLLPAVLLIVYGYAVNLDVRNIRVAVYDMDRSAQSRAFLRSLEASGYFDLHHVEGLGDTDDHVEHGDALVGIEIPRGFAADLADGREAHVQAVVDATNANIATIAMSYLDQIAGAFSNDLRIARVERLSGQRARGFPPVRPEPRIWYNPQLRSTFFIVPGVVGLIMMLVGTNATALSIVLEKEQGTFEKLIVTPLRPYEIIVGKALPWAVLALGESLATFAIGIALFRVPMRGSWGLLAAGSLLFLYCATSMGLFISCVAKTQMAALMTTVFVSILPTFLLSGFVFPIRSMPIVLRLVTRLVPARYFMVILRGVFLKQSGLRHLWSQFAVLGAYGIAMNVLAVRRFRKRLD